MGHGYAKSSNAQGAHARKCSWEIRLVDPEGCVAILSVDTQSQVSGIMNQRRKARRNGITQNATYLGGIYEVLHK
jgi:phosphatidylserine decarboxylase